MENKIIITNEELLPISNINMQTKLDIESSEIKPQNLPESQFSKKESKIFQNYFTLQFIKDSIQTKFDKELYKFSKSELFSFIFLTSLYVVGYICYLVLQESIVMKHMIKQINNYNIVALTLLGSSILMYILKKVFIDNLIIAKVFKYSFFTFFTGSITTLNNIIHSFFVEETLCAYYFFFYFTEFAIKIVYIMVVDFEFLRIFIVHLTYIVIAWVTASVSIETDPDIVIKSIRLNISFAILTVISYFYDKFYRKLFYLSHKVESQKNFYLSMLNNMQNGIFVYDNHKQKIKFINT